MRGGSVYTGKAAAERASHHYFLSMNRISASTYSTML